jgi:hypothetical protein
MVERHGYKIVRSDGSSTVGTPPVTYVVGQTYHLPPDADVTPCKVGFHYCPVARDCMQYVTAWWPDFRLFEVAVLDDARVVTDDGIKYACSGLVVVADVTAQAQTLLSRIERWQDACPVAAFDDAARWTSRLVECKVYGNHHADDGPAIVYRNRYTGITTKSWRHHGLPSACYAGRFSSVSRGNRGSGVISVMAANFTSSEVTPSDADYARLDAMLDVIEPCELA